MVEVLITKYVPFLQKTFLWSLKWFGKLEPTLIFKGGQTTYKVKGHPERNVILQLKVLKKGLKEIRIDSVVIENSSDGEVNLNKYIKFDSFIRLKLEKDDFQTDSFVFNKDGTMDTLLQMHQIRAKIIDTKKRVYYSEWFDYSSIKDSLEF